MLEISLEKGPLNERIRQKLMTPFSCIISPAANSDIPSVSYDIQTFPRCSKCGAYFSRLSQKENNYWICNICGCHNKSDYPKDFPDANDFQFIVNELLGEEILIIYLSLDFHLNDLKIITSEITTFIKTLNDKPAIFIVGHNDAPFSILCPHVSCYKLENKIIKYSPPAEINVSQFTNFPAPVVHFSDIGDDLSKYIFSPIQMNSVINTLEKLTSMSGQISFTRFLNVCEKLTFTIQNNPIHIVSILPRISDIPNKFKKVYENCCRIDILTPTVNNEAQNAFSILPGLVLFFNSKNLARKLQSAISEVTAYQWTALSRANNAKTSWRTLPYPQMIDDRGVAFSPIVPSKNQPFVLDIHPNINNSLNEKQFIHLQVTTKMIMTLDHQNSKGHQNLNSDENENENMNIPVSVLRVFNRKIEVTDNIEEIAKSIKPNSLVWLWLTRTLDQSTRDVLAALFRATAKIVDVIGFDHKISKDLAHSCCSQKFSDIMSQDSKHRLLSRYSLCLTHPSQYSLIPLYDEKRGIALFGNTVFSQEKNSKEAIDEVSKIYLFGKIESPIPEWCKVPDPQNLEFLTSLIPE